MLAEGVPCTGRRAWPSAYRGRDVARPHGVHGASCAWEGLPPSAHGTPALPWGVPLGTLDPQGPAWILPDGCLPTDSLVVPFLMLFPQPLCRPASRMGPSHTAWHPDETRSSLFDGSLLAAKSVRSANAVGCALDRSRIQPLPGTCCLDQHRSLLTGTCFCPSPRGPCRPHKRRDGLKRLIASHLCSKTSSDLSSQVLVRGRK